MIVIKITGFYSNNFLSFRDFQMTCLDNRLNILVGPNGSGKSNILYAIEQVIEVLNKNISAADEFRMNSNLSEVTDSSVIAIDVNFDEPDEQELLAHYISYSLFPRDGLHNFLVDGNNQSQQINRDRLQSLIQNIVAQAVVHPSLTALYSGQLRMSLDNSVHSSISVHYKFNLEGKEYFWFLQGDYNNLIGNRFQHRSQSWTQSDFWTRWMRSMGTEKVLELRKWLVEEADEMPYIVFDFSSILSQIDNSILVSMGGMNDLMGNGPEVPSYNYLRRKLGTVNDSTNPIQSSNVFQHLLRDSVIKTANIHVEPRQTFDYTEWDEPRSSVLDGSSLALHLFRLKNGDKEQREEFEKIRSTYFKLTNGWKLDVQLRTVLEYVDKNTFPYLSVQKRIKRNFNAVPMTTRESKPLLHIELIVINPQEREIPISRSGAGMIELAFLCTVLSMSNSYVILLDEPGTHVHAGILRQIAQLLPQVRAQIFVVTHSPYLLSARTLTNTRRVYYTGEKTMISGRYVPPVRRDWRLKAEQAFGRDSTRANMLFYNLVILTDGESEFHALPIWFNKYTRSSKTSMYVTNRDRDNVQSETLDRFWFEDFNINLITVGGKPNFPSFLRFLMAFHIPWMIVCDGDSLGRTDNICDQLSEFNIHISPELSFEEQRNELRKHNIFVIGDNIESNFETIPEVQSVLRTAKEKAGKSKAQQAQWIAEEISCPIELMQIFDSAIDLSKNARLKSPRD